MVWTIELRRMAALAATVFLSAVMLSGCVADTPKTQLTWFPKPDPKPVARVARRDVAPPAPRRVHTKPVQTVALDCPPNAKAKPDNHGWYTQNTLPPPQPTPDPATYSAPTLGFAWPLTGPVIADYGTDTSGGRNAGIDIAAPFGTPIRASAAGQVSYAGNELRGYGNLVLIKHDDGYVTAYAHAERIVVGRGDFVQKGQIIGYAGQSGDVTSPELHFEIRKGVTPLNPRSLLGASRSS